MSKRYWLRGGITGLIIGLTIMLARVALSMMLVDDTGNSGFSSAYSVAFFTRELINVVELSVFGFISGWLYGKMRKEKSQTS